MDQDRGIRDPKYVEYVRKYVRIRAVRARCAGGHTLASAGHVFARIRFYAAIYTTCDMHIAPGTGHVGPSIKLLTSGLWMEMKLMNPLATSKQPEVT